MPRKALVSTLDLLPLTAIESRAQEFGSSLQQLARLQVHGIRVPRTAAFGSAYFRERLDKPQRTEHELASLVKTAHRRGHRLRCYAAQQAVCERGLDPELASAALEWASARSAEARLLVWTSLVTPGGSLSWLSGFRQVVPVDPARLSQVLLQAFASAYDPELVQGAARAGAKSYALAVALAELPTTGAKAELWIDPHEGGDSKGTDSERAPAFRGVRLKADGSGSKFAGWLDDASELVPLSSAPSAIARPLRMELPKLLSLLPAGRVRLDLLLDDDGMLVTSLAHSAAPIPARRWVALGWGEDDVPCEATLSLLERVSTHVLRPWLDAIGERPSRRSSLIEPKQGRLYVDLTALTQALRKRYRLESELTERLLAGSPVTRGPRPSQEQRFVFPRRYARLSLAESKLRTELRHYESEAIQQQQWLHELDLAILPDDGLRTTLRETDGFYRRTMRLYLSSKLYLMQGLVATTELMHERAHPEAIRNVFCALCNVGEVPSAEASFDVLELQHALSSDGVAREAIQSGLSEPASLAPGPLSTELRRFLDKHGDWSLSAADPELPPLAERPELLLGLLGALDAEAPGRWRARRSELGALEAADRIAEAAGWLERHAIGALLARAAGFVRVHERLRVWLGRAAAMLRKVTLDADRRLRRLNPRLPRGSAWHLDLEELTGALFARQADLVGVVARRAEAQRRRRNESALGGQLSVCECSPRVLPELGARLEGCFTGTGTFTGPVVRAGSQLPARLGARDVLVCESLDAAAHLLVGFAGAVVAPAGTPLSQLAVIARELGVPAVLGLGASAALLRQGERVFVDGDRGFVERRS